jgi:alkyl hydroperoxide reductase subunit AhpC
LTLELAGRDESANERRPGISFPIVADTDRHLIKAVGIYDEANDIAWPTVVIVGPAGRIEWIDLPTSYVIEKRPPAKKLLEVVEGLRATAEPDRQ